MDKPRQGPGTVGAQGVGDHPAHILKSERIQTDLLHTAAGFTDCRQPLHQEMCRRDPVIAIGADQKQVMQIWLSQQILKEVERGCIQPLQVVKEESQWVLWSGEHAEQAT